MLKFLRAAKQIIEKRRAALREDFPLRDHIQAPIPSVELSPFPHIVADNFLKEETYEKLLKHFNSVRDRGFSEQDDPARFHPFLNLKGEYEYDGYVYVPRPEEEPALNMFFSLSWNLFLSKLFKKSTGWCTSLAYHYHPAGDRTGFVHHDHALHAFSPDDALANGVIFRTRGTASGVSHDALLLKEMRSIALLYYFGDNAWQEGDGGETGLYFSKGGMPVQLVEPKNNRLFAFEISHKSFHAFQRNGKPRSCIVQWLHAAA